MYTHQKKGTQRHTTHSAPILSALLNKRNGTTQTNRAQSDTTHSLRYFVAFCFFLFSRCFLSLYVACVFPSFFSFVLRTLTQRTQTHTRIEYTLSGAEILYWARWKWSERGTNRQNRCDRYDARFGTERSTCGEPTKWWGTNEQSGRNGIK